MKLIALLWASCLCVAAGAMPEMEVAPMNLAASMGCQRCCSTGDCSRAYQDNLQGQCCTNGFNPTCCPNVYNGMNFQCAANGAGCAPGGGGGQVPPAYQPQYGPAPSPYAPAPAPYPQYQPSPPTQAPVAAAGDAGCPWALNLGSVGSCMVFGCSSSRGPTYCSSGSCYCQKGFCRYPASTLHVQSRYCVQRVPGSTCHMTRVCYKGGLTSSFCEKGLCMCKWGYRLNSENKCVSQSTLSLAEMGNSTEDREFLQQQENAVAFNVAMFAVWVAGFATALIAGATFTCRKFHVEPEQENMYTQFLTCE